MRTQELENNLVGAVRDVLGTMFFTDVVDDQKLPVLLGDQPLTVRVGFAGETAGVLHLRVPAETAGVLASNFLGAQPGEPLTGEQIDEVVRELSNMLCGAFLSRHEAEQIFELTSPENVEHPGPEPGEIRRGMELENGCLELTLNWRRV